MSTKKPAFTRVFLACVSFLPTTSGTGILPFETVTLIRVPMSTTKLVTGSCSKIVPSGLSLSIGVTRPKSSFASVRTRRASSIDGRFTKSGTGTWSLPAETIKLTAWPASINSPAAGSCPIISPLGTLSSAWGVSVPTFRPISVRANLASSTVLDFRFGVVTKVWPGASS